MAAEIKSSKKYHPTKKAMREGIVIITAIIVPFTNMPDVGSLAVGL